MKRFIKENFIFAFLFLISSFLFFSCIQGNLCADNGKYRFTGIVNDPSEIDFSRTILPPAADRNYDLYLFGQSETDSLSVTKINLSGGSFSLEVNPGVWEFTLYALPQGAAVPATESKALENALLIGRTTCDLSTGDGSAVFKLTSDSVTGNGSFEITIYLSDDRGVTSWYASRPAGSWPDISIKNRMTGAVVRGTPLVDHILASENRFVYSDEIPAGTYDVAVCLKAVDGKIMQEYPETICIYKGRKSTGTMYVPYLLRDAPSKVKSISTTYIKDSEDTADNPDSYKVHFHWDASDTKSEEYFELQVADITESTNYGAAGVSWGEWDNTLLTVYTPTEKLMQNETLPANAKRRVFASGYIDYSAGSLEVNSKDAVMWLSLGRKYVARIRAVNEAAASVWTEATYPDGLNGNIVDPFIRDATTAYFVDYANNSAGLINRFRIRYYFNGGDTGRHIYFNIPRGQRKFNVLTKVQDGVDGSGNPVWKTEEQFAGIAEYCTAAATPVAIWDGTVPAASTYDDLAKSRADSTRAPLKYWIIGDFSLEDESTWNIRWRATDTTHAQITTATNVDLWAIYYD